MKNLNKFRLRKVSFMLSLIMIAGSLSGPVFASQASASNEMSEGKRLILGWIQLPQYKCHNCCET